MESIDISQPNPTDSLVPNTGQQSDTFPSNPLQLPNPDSNQSGSGKDPSLSDEAALNAATWFAKGQLNSFASDEDFLNNMEQAFGNDWQPQQAEDLIQGLASGDAMPKVETLPASELKANGAFGEDTIYLSEEFLSNAKSEKVSSALLEEIGHTATDYYEFNIHSIQAEIISDRGRFEDGKDEPLLSINEKNFKLYDLNGEGDGMVIGETFNFGDGRSVNTYDNSTEVTLKEKGDNGYKLIETENVLHYQELSKYDLTLEENGAEYKLKYSVDVEQVPPPKLAKV
ncbi:MAG: hypothetical protein BRC48_16465 [Cyanobacteria bacterium QS_9_48_30]|nr:MAG: hypothetical protein BRC48_16465 [Cyanobacteria bacterium QS_9_48_30]